MLDDLLLPAPDSILTVTRLTQHIKRQLEGQFQQVWVQGEVSNLRRQSSGHVYFSLKDSGAQIPCVLFARDAARQSFAINEGMQITLLGSISVYEPHGRYQLIGKIAIESGQGQLQAAFEKLKRKLATEGLFDAEKKLSLPTLPQRIAVITSPTGAAIKDFLRILNRREFKGEVAILPARVQGREATAEIHQMLQTAIASQPAFDLIVLTRGGGSIEDLWCFNNEQLTRTVAASPVPIISAVGHEIDHVLTDYAASFRAETPSGAAERISSLYLETTERIENVAHNLTAYINLKLKDSHHRLQQRAHELEIHSPERSIQRRHMYLDDLQNRLNKQLSDATNANKEKLHRLANCLAQNHPLNRIELTKQKLSNSLTRLQTATENQFKTASNRLDQLNKRIQSSSYNATLKRGYTVIQKPDGEILSTAQAAAQEAHLKVTFHDGSLELSQRNHSE